MAGLLDRADACELVLPVGADPVAWQTGSDSGRILRPAEQTQKGGDCDNRNPRRFFEHEQMSFVPGHQKISPRLGGRFDEHLIIRIGSGGWPIAGTDPAGYGKIFSRIHCCRAANCSGRFIWSRPIVARPVAVNPSNLPVLCSRDKRSSQRCFRGWNRETTVCVAGSMASKWSLLRRLQARQLNAKFDRSSEPPRPAGTMCSTPKGRLKMASGAWQYSQRWLDLRATGAYRGFISPSQGGQRQPAHPQREPRRLPASQVRPVPAAAVWFLCRARPASGSLVLPAAAAAGP